MSGSNRKSSLQMIVDSSMESLAYICYHDPMVVPLLRWSYSNQAEGRPTELFAIDIALVNSVVLLFPIPEEPVCLYGIDSTGILLCRCVLEERLSTSDTTKLCGIRRPDLIRLIRESFPNGTVPSSWKITKVVEVVNQNRTYSKDTPWWGSMQGIRIDDFGANVSSLLLYRQITRRSQASSLAHAVSGGILGPFEN